MINFRKLLKSYRKWECSWHREKRGTEESIEVRGESLGRALFCVSQKEAMKTSFNGKIVLVKKKKINEILEK